jgi:exonuclease III
MVYLATWNVQSMFRVNAVKESVNELKKYKINIATIQEIKWQGNNITDIGEYNICYSSSDEKNNVGTGFLIHKSLNASIIESEPICEKRHYIKLKGKFCNISIIWAHALTEKNMTL